MLKVKPHPDYPPEEGRYLRGNDSSPAGVAIVLNQDEDKISKEIQSLVRTGVETAQPCPVPSRPQISDLKKLSVILLLIQIYGI